MGTMNSEVHLVLFPSTTLLDTPYSLGASKAFHMEHVLSQMNEAICNIFERTKDVPVNVILSHYCGLMLAL